MECGDEGEWWAKASATYDKYPDANGSAEFYSSAILEKLLKEVGFNYGFRLSEIQASDAQKACDILQSLWDRIRNPKINVRGTPLSIPMNLITALRILDKLPEALNVAQQANEIFPDIDDVKQRLAAVFLEQGKTAEAENLLQELAVNSDVFMLRFAIAANSANWPNIRNLVDEHFEHCSSQEG